MLAILAYVFTKLPTPRKIQGVQLKAEPAQSCNKLVTNIGTTHVTKHASTVNHLMKSGIWHARFNILYPLQAYYYLKVNWR
jgi:hypothetical protein